MLAAKPEFEQLAVNELDDGSRFDGSPAVDGNRLLVRSGKFLYCLGNEGVTCGVAVREFWDSVGGRARLPPSRLPDRFAARQEPRPPNIVIADRDGTW